MTSVHPARPRSRGGRTPDPRRGDAIRAATLAGLTEVGYEDLTIEMVAARANAGKGAIYRRWPSKAALVADAVSHLRPLPATPDHGNLDDDLDALACLATDPQPDGDTVSIMVGLLTSAHRDPHLAAALERSFLEPRRDAVRRVLDRARTRGELADDVDVDLIVDVVPAMVIQRAVFTGQGPDVEFVRRIIRTVLLPALRRTHQGNEHNRQDAAI